MRPGLRSEDVGQGCGVRASASASSASRLRRCVLSSIPSMDGVTGLATPTIDGMELSTHLAKRDALLALAAAHIPHP